MNKLTISVAEFCEMVGIGRTLAFSLIRSGEVDTIRIGRRRFVLRTSVEALIERALQREQS
jgi:excisionase family DNA binding protein